MNEIDIASFAESLLEEEVSKGKPVQFAAAQAPDAPDVSDVQVSHDFASQILSESFSVAPTQRPVAKVAPKVEQPKPERINEESVYKQHLLNEYKKKVDDLKELVSIMESLGIVGTGAATGATFTTSLGTGPMGGKKAKKKKQRKQYVPGRYSR